MDTVKIGRWIVRADVRRTAEAHATLTMSGAEECGCDGCKNFNAVRPQLLRGPLGAVLSRLGISPPWEVEVYEVGRAASGLHHYGGWFHFVGTIESGTPAWKPIEGGPTGRLADFEPISSTVSIGVRTDAALVRPSFQGLPLVQLDISAELPWVIDAPEPG
jgi:hypothetical protein